MEASGELIVNAAARHLFERGLRDVQQLRIVRGLVAFEYQVDCGRVREFRTAAKAAVARVESLEDGGDLQVHELRAPIAARSGKHFRLRHGTHKRRGRFLDLAAPHAVGIGNTLEDAAKTRTAHGVDGREIRAAVKGAAVRKQKSGKRPAALSGNGVDGGLISGIHVRAFIAIDFHGNKQPIDQRGQFGIFVALPVDHVAPVTPHRSDIEQNGFVFGARASESLGTPLIPVDGLIRRGAQVGTRGMCETVGAFFRHVRILSRLVRGYFSRRWPAGLGAVLRDLRLLTARDCSDSYRPARWACGP